MTPRKQEAPFIIGGGETLRAYEVLFFAGSCPPSQNHLYYSCKCLDCFRGARILIPSSDSDPAMANLVRVAKSASDWSDHELTAYNITVSSRYRNPTFPSQALEIVPALDPYVIMLTLSHNSVRTISIVHVMS